MNNLIKKVTLAFALTFTFSVAAQLAPPPNQNEPNTRGISVSPAHFHLNQKTGEERTYEITVNNDTDTDNEFQVNVFDFNMNGKGKSSFLEAGDGEYTLSEWMTISPTFVELKAGEKKKVKFTVSIPSDKTGERAAWSIIMIEQAEPRKTIEPSKKGGETVALGVLPTFAFGVFVYQNPPNVATENIEMTNFSSAERDDVTYIKIEVDNKGDGIAYCTAYVDITNLDNGEQERLTVKRFTIVPSLIRDFVFALPKELKPGNYLATGVLDYENSDEIQAAKMNFTINNQ